MHRSAVRPSPLFLAILAVAVVGGVLAAFGDINSVFAQESDPLLIGGIVLLVLGGWGVSLCLHEFGHAIFAYRGGDREVRLKGYLTLDPRRYTDPVLSLLLPLLLLAVGGIPLPGGAVWINHHALHSRRVESMVSLAGPLMNLLIGLLLTTSVAVLPMPAGLAAGLSYLALLQVLAFVLNILPVPGLDGWGALEPHLPYEARRFGAKARPWAPLILFAVLIGIRPVGEVFFGISEAVFGAIGGEELFYLIGANQFMFWR
ncbi:Zn-dependent protease [Tamaricihabitans halophyticus]|uniref:Zn-dependent protease n=1 Tax=Tamaricihabitans halophyticus TaxID=1262583 RepID=A0A4R2QK86_9PSEU|nr:site-2 protease family protein [Tamaricihabitans halophyticus]TCP49239.1 Zn-dependent protease [Tamaricihabitans halophyticus]